MSRCRRRRARWSRSDHNRKVHYEGAVSMWQGANRIQADVVDLNRNPDKRNLVADGHVITNLWEQPKDDAKAAAKAAAAGKKPSKKAAVLTVVQAQHLNYTEENRLAVYTGGVVLKRPDMQVKSRELRAFLADADADSRLEKAFADGTVEIHQASAGRQRTGTGEHGEYYAGDQKVILRGGHAEDGRLPAGRYHGRGIDLLCER